MTRRARGAALATVAVAAALVAAGAASAGPARADTPCLRGTPPSTTKLDTWAQKRLGAEDPARSFEGWGVTIAVVGSGVDANHPQLRGRVVGGANLPDAADARQDCLGLGTVMAGAAAAGPSVDGGFQSPVRGLAPQARIMPIRVPDGVAHPGSAATGATAKLVADDLAAAVDFARTRGARIVVLPPVALPPSPGLRRAVSSAEAAGVLVIVPEPPNAKPEASDPLLYPEVLVATPTDTKLTASVSALPRALRLAAPGTGVAVLLPGGVGTVSDAAVAAGWVAGAAALLIDADPRRTPAELRIRLFSTPTAINGGIPWLDPAAALAAQPVSGAQAAGADQAVGVPPDGSNVVGTAGPASPAPHSTVRSRSIAVALLCLGVPAVIGGLAAAWVRGRRRDWRPAPPVDPVAATRREPVRGI